MNIKNTKRSSIVREKIRKGAWGVRVVGTTRLGFRLAAIQDENLHPFGQRHRRALDAVKYATEKFPGVQVVKAKVGEKAIAV